MDFFDNLSDKIANAGDAAYKKGKDFADTQKAQADIREEERKIARTYEEIGRAYVQDNPGDANARYGDKMARIKTSEENIQRLQAEIRDIKHLGTCPKCGAEYPQGQSFCSHCGNKL